MGDIAESPIDWETAWPQGQLSVELTPAEHKHPRPHQVEAIEAVLNGYAVGNDRGKLIMACGTGKTFTALKIAEAIAAENGDTARVLFMVPSISVLNQSLREWTAQSDLDMRAFGVCSTPRSANCATSKTSTSTTCRCRSPPTPPSCATRWNTASAPRASRWCSPPTNHGPRWPRPRSSGPNRRCGSGVVVEAQIPAWRRALWGCWSWPLL